MHASNVTGYFRQRKFRNKDFEILKYDLSVWADLLHLFREIKTDICGKVDCLNLEET